MTLDISQYRVKNDVVQPPFKAVQDIQPSQPEMSQVSMPSVDISQYQAQQEPSFWDNAGRNVLRWGSRVVEQILGGPGDLAEAGRSILSGQAQLAPSNILGFEKPKVPEALKFNQIDEPVQQGIKRLLEPSQSNLLGSLPRSEELEALNKTASKGYLAPQEDWEQKSDEITKNLGRLLFGRTLPGPRIPGAPRSTPRFDGVRKVGQDIGNAIISEGVKEGVKLFGGSESSQEKAKAATLFTMGLMLPRITGQTSADRFVRDIYQQRDDLIPQNAMFNTAGIENNLRNFINNRLKYGGPTPEKNTVLAVTEDFLNRIASRGGQMTTQELLEFGRNINRNSASVYMQPLDKTGIRAARSFYGELNDIFNNAIEGQLATINPQALQLHRNAQGAWGALQQSRRVQEFVSRNVKGLPFKTGVASMLGGSLFGSIANPVATATALAGAGASAGLGAGILSAGEALTRMYLNPTLRHYYSLVIMNSLRENIPAMVSAMKKLDDAYYKEANKPNR